MFYVFDLTSNETIATDTLQAHELQPTTTPSNQQHIKLRTILNTLKRSRTGCLQCRARKKKCNEEHPVCGSCKRRKVNCSWRVTSKFKILKNGHQENSTSSEEIQESNYTRIDNQSTNDDPPDQNILGGSDKALHQESDNTDIISLDKNLSSISPKYLSEPEYDFLDLSFLEHCTPSPINSHIFQPFKHLNVQGLYFLDGFIANVAKKFSIGHESSNYILKTFYQLSEEHEAVSYALAAWGGIFIEGGFTENVNHFLGEAIFKMSQEYPNLNNISKKDVYILLNYYLVYIGLQVCAGDVSQWHQIFHRTIDLVKRQGGLSSIIEMFDCSNEIKWLLSDIQYHDILSLNTFQKGTMLPMEEYNSVFKEAKILELGNYGLDPFQGCIQPIYLVLGEITSLAVDLKLRQQEIEIDGDITLRLEFYHEADKCYRDLSYKISNCIPNIEQMKLIKDDRYELKLHLTLFEVYLLTCQLCLNYLIKKLPASTLDMQLLVLNCLALIDILIDTKMKSALSFLLLVCGITCCSKNDRSSMLNRFKIVSDDYKAGNVTLIKSIVEKVWERNQNGQLCVDWLTICQENNWNISFC